MTKELDLLKFVDFVSYTLFFDSIAGNGKGLGEGGDKTAGNPN